MQGASPGSLDLKQNKFFPAFDPATIVRNRLFLFGIGRFLSEPTENERIAKAKRQARYRKEAPILLRVLEH